MERSCLAASCVSFIEVLKCSPKISLDICNQLNHKFSFAIQEPKFSIQIFFWPANNCGKVVVDKEVTQPRGYL